MFNEIVVCWDGSRQAGIAAQKAAEIARKFGAQVTLLNVQPPVFRNVPYALGMEEAPDISELTLYAEKSQQHMLCEAVDTFEKAGVPCRPRGETGQTVETIVHVAEEEKADLIVLGSRGLGGFQRLMLGSISDGVLHHAHCPVLIVR